MMDLDPRMVKTRRIYTTAELSVGKVFVPNTSKHHIRRKCEIENRDLDWHYIKNVLRMQDGEIVRVFNSREEYLGRMHGSCLQLEALIRKCESDNEAQLPRIDVAIGMLKPSTMAVAMENIAQFGVHSIYPLITQRVQAPKDQRRILQSERYRNILISSVEQSENFHVPHVKECLDLSKFIDQWNINQLEPQGSSTNSKVMIVCDDYVYRVGKTNPGSLNANGLLESNFLSADTSSLSKASSIMLVVGPEGGFSAEESMSFKSASNSRILTFNSILRSENAIIAALSILEFLSQNPTKR